MNKLILKTAKLKSIYNTIVKICIKIYNLKSVELFFIHLIFSFRKFTQ
jgi:hypothetical protein